MDRKTFFLFDLDGTITQEETLPLIAHKFNVKKQIDDLTINTVMGNVPFIESFIRRVNILKDIPFEDINNLLGNVRIHSVLCEFINLHKNNCAIVTGNLSCWISNLVSKIGVQAYSSVAQVNGHYVKKIQSIIKKEDIVKKYQNEGYKVVFIGDGNNDVEAMRIADISIASSLIHSPVCGVITTADYLVTSEKALCRILNQLL